MMAVAHSWWCAMGGIISYTARRLPRDATR